MADIHTESVFEDEICAHLAGHGWFHRNEKPLDLGYDRRLALFPEDALAWVKDTQPQAWAKFEANHKSNPDAVFLKRLAEELDRVGALDVLRKGFKDINATFKMAQFAPANALNPKTSEDYRKNRLRVVRQLHYSEHNENCIDLVLFLNGIPVATLELKTDTTQPVWNAIRQYQYDRLPTDPKSREKEPLLQFGRRALVHFATSCDEVYMATRLEGKKTFFLPFNRGRDGGAGNPANPNGYATSYLWGEIFRKDVWMLILGRYLHLERKETVDSINGKKSTKETLIFPRFHQLDAVRALLAQTKTEGVGGTFLIQHSAGSGKSNTIAWSAHQLASLHDAENCKIFGSVIVITDRKVLDSQLQDTIYQFEHQHGVVQKIDDNSLQLADALNAGKPVIITTIQKFPYVLEKVAGLKDRMFALIIDEAHSSQSGKAAHKLREVLTSEALETLKKEEGTEQEEDLSIEDILNQVVASRKRPANVTYYAFTATPKAKTIELFGRPGPDGKPAPFHTYSMRQAIEEDFILDVLKHYTTYDVFWKLSQVGDDKLVESGKARKQIARYVKLHPTNIAQKVSIIVEHFRKKVMAKIGGRAKAMVVTDSRLAAVRYKKALDDYLKKYGYDDCKALVAYSGVITDKETGTDKASEGDLNDKGQKDDRIKEDFATDEYRILLVANKFQTGFDQPLLHTMYVDKKLSGVLAVQTLSRLNRTCPGKEDTFVLDFVNKAEDILEAFRPYYRTAALSDVTDPNLVHRLKAKLDATGVYLQSEVDALAKAFFAKNGTQATLQAQLKPAADRYKCLTEEKQELFRKDLGTFVRAYEFLSQIVPYEDIELEKLYVYGRCLLPRLAHQDDGDDWRVDNSINLTHLRVQKRGEQAIKLETSEVKELKPLYEAGSGKAHPGEDEPLSAIVKKMNELFSGNLTDADKLGYVTHLVGKMVENETLQEQAQANDSMHQFANGDYKSVLKDSVIDAMTSHTAMADQALRDEKVLAGLAELLLPVVYKRLRLAGDQTTPPM